MYGLPHRNGDSLNFRISLHRSQIPFQNIALRLPCLTCKLPKEKICLFKPYGSESVTDEFNDLLGRSLAELRKHFLDLEQPVPQKLVERLEKDSRSGAKKLALAIQQRQLKNRREDQRLRKLLEFESELWSQGVHNIAGIDEAGMAPLAGPVVAAAVILPQGYTLQGLDDSKKISNEQRRLELSLRIKAEAICWCVGRAEPEEIDSINIYQAGLLAMRRAMEGLSVAPDYLLIDARTLPNCVCPQKGIIHGDALSASIAAASIIAKTTRDLHMREMDLQYPEYGFASHKGYPTPEHLNALRNHGSSAIHRKSFAPVRATLGRDPIQNGLFPNCQ
jgi:ribonuclease HII